MPLATAEHALLDERRRITRDEALAVAALPLDELPSVIALAHKVRLAWCGPEVELESLINAKSGACPEDCAFCSQSVRFQHRRRRVRVPRHRRDPRSRARATRAAGATPVLHRRRRARPRRAPPATRDRRRRPACSARRASKSRARSACSNAEQAQRLADAGVRRYNHNLETCRALFPTICTTHTYDDRVETAQLARDVGHGAVLRRHPRHGRDARTARRLRVRARGARPVRGADQPARPPARHTARRRDTISPREALQAIALFRLILPRRWLRLAGGRERVLGELQGMGLSRAPTR